MATDLADRSDIATCRVCGRLHSGGFALCFCCATIVEQLRMPLVPVVAMADYRIGDRLHRLLRGYKDAPSPAARHARTSALAALVELWLESNADVLRARFVDWDLVTTVPSTCGRVGSPVDALAGAVPGLAALHRSSVLSPGTDRVGHLRAARRGYVVSASIGRRGLRGRRILVLDDTVVTGARAQSAAAALRAGGARVSGILAVGRVLGTHAPWLHGPEHREPARVVGPAGAVGRSRVAGAASLTRTG
jgi:predicted amidophosphoribosyltransferase